MIASFLGFVDRVANLAGALTITVVLLAAAPSLTAMVAASHLLGA